MLFAVSKTKTVLKFAAFFICAAALFCQLCSCNIISLDNAKAIKIEVINNAPPQIVGEFNYADFALKVSYDDGTSKTLALKEHMIAKSDLAKLSQSGFYFITVNYLNLSCVFIVSVIDQRQTPLNFAVVSGAHISENDGVDSRKLTALLEKYSELSIDHLIFNGDMIQGSSEHYALLSNCLNAAFDNIPPLYYPLGEAERLLTTGLSEQAAFEIFNGYFEQEKNFHKTICGTDFLFISGVDIGGYIDENLQAEIELSLSQVPEDRLFFVVYGGKIGSAGGKTLQELLSNSKNAILITTDKEHFKANRNITAAQNTVIKCGIATAKSIYDNFVSLNDDVQIKQCIGNFEREFYGYTFSVLGKTVKVELIGGESAVYIIDCQGNCECFGDNCQESDITVGGSINIAQDGRLARLTGDIQTDKLAEAFVIDINSQNTQRRILVLNNTYQLRVNFEFEVSITESAHVELTALNFDKTVSLNGIECIFVYEEPQSDGNQNSLFDYLTQDQAVIFDGQMSLSGKALKLSCSDGQDSIRLEFTNDELFDLKSKSITLSGYFSRCYCTAALGLITDNGDYAYLPFLFENTQDEWQETALQMDILSEVLGLDTSRIKTLVLTVNFVKDDANCLVFLDNFLII